MVRLEQWLNKPDRKPLLLEGARQIGKTYILKEFGKKYFRKYHYVNFEDNADYKNLFDKDLNPQRIISDLKIYFQIDVDIQNDLVIFDEIQQCPRAITSLKYFYENLPSIKLAAAGSLLGVTLGETSFPVGKVDFLSMYPMSFAEFLLALGKTTHYEILQTLDLENLSPLAHKSFWGLMKDYFITGGLPEIVQIFLLHQNERELAFEEVRKKQSDLIKAYHSDIAKHSGKLNSMHIEGLLTSAAMQLGRDERGSANKFKFKDSVPGLSQFTRLESALHWLLRAGLLLKSSIIHQVQLPLKAYAEPNQFKLFIFDIGILGALMNLRPATILDYDYGTYKGFFAENFAAQELICSANTTHDLYTWKGKSAEIEFVLDIDGEIVPIEIKSGSLTKSKSLQVFIEKYRPKLSFVFSGREYKFHNDHKKLYLPLYMISQVSSYFKMLRQSSS